ncbi:MAG TPA: NUDIX domain-containing protein [Polyangiaceae bacterium]|nr:NUDIX domain-containing protein [Polyangiaceae bacterium]
MAKTSAGLVMVDGQGRVLLVHPGGPFFHRRDDGVWSIPKGLCEPGESLQAAARREFREELGFDPAPSELFELGSVKQSGGKTVHAWAFTGEWDPGQLRSVVFELEWPPGSGRMQVFPEVDRAEFFEAAVAERKIIAAQRPFVARALAWARAQRP